MTRIYFPGVPPVHGIGEIAGDDAHHVTRVLRMGVGDALTLFDGLGSEYRAVITALGRRSVEVRIGERVAVDRESPLTIALAQSVSTGERMDYTVQKAVELGIARIQPLATERSVVHLDAARAAKRTAHWESVAIAACAQCGRNRLPEIAPIMPFVHWLAALPRDDGSLRLLMSPEATSRLHDLPRPSGVVWLLCGPEGGIAPSEAQDAARLGFTAIRLGPRVLRTETAAIAALAAMQTLWGDF